MPQIDPHIFRAYDIRGTVPTQLNEAAALLIGRGFGSVLRELYGISHPRVVVGRDMRTHSPALEDAVVEGLLSTGCHILRIGQTPSPVNYFTMCRQELDGGVQITASHNPAEDNGLKLQIRNAEAHSGDDLQKLRERIDTQAFVEGKGTQASFDALKPYTDHLVTLFPNAGHDARVAIDGGNGIAGPTVVDVLKRLGAEVIELFTEPDGTFPNHPADPSKHETLADLQSATKDRGADIGLAFDGDGDRLGIVDENGTIRTADEILLLLAQDHLKRNRGAPVIFTVSNSSVLQTEIERWGGKCFMCKVGHSFVEHAMREHGALLGGEQSGHFFCGENYYGFDDALVAALRVLDILTNAERPLSGLFEEFPKVYQAPEWRPACPDHRKGAVIEAVTKYFQKNYPVNTLDGARIDFGDGAWAGIRQSNTAPKISVCIEARTPQKLHEVEGIVREHLNTYLELKTQK